MEASGWKAGRYCGYFVSGRRHVTLRHLKCVENQTLAADGEKRLNMEQDEA